MRAVGKIDQVRIPRSCWTPVVVAISLLVHMYVRSDGRLANVAGMDEKAVKTERRVDLGESSGRANKK